jgi:hypothetical protein
MPMKRLLFIFVLLVPMCAQQWSGILSPSRAINWSNAGLPATLPDGETTPNPWTPPTRTKCGSTISSGASAATINAALAACSKGTYVLLGPGTFTVASTQITMYAQSGVTLRGSGAQSTKIVLTGSAYIHFGIVWNNGQCAWTSGYSVGTTSLTMNSCSGPTLVAGELLFLGQCDTGYSSSSVEVCTTGSATDNGGLFVCGAVGAPCSQQSRTDNHRNQGQIVYVKSITGNCSSNCTVNFTPGIYAPNWSSGQHPFTAWQSSSSAGNTAQPYGNGLEDLTVDSTGDTYSEAVFLDNTYASWIKGVRFVGAAGGDAVYFSFTDNCLLANNYLFADMITSGADAVFLQVGTSSDFLMINNIVTGGQTWNGVGTNEGMVMAYNYGRDSQTSYYQLATYDHEPGSAFNLFEANQSGLFLGDNTWGTQDLSTVFRGYYNGTDPPYASSTNPRVISVNNYVRFDNFIGNVLGGSQISLYQTTSGYNYVYQFGTTDPLALASTFRWGNFDNVTNGVRWCGNAASAGWSAICSLISEVPTILTGNAAAFNNLVPSSTTLPCSFFLPGYTSAACTPHTSGGTGLSFWKVCTAWAAFPTSCSATQLQPFPPNGPDVTGGTYMSGHANDLPASIAFANLPIDAAYQHSYTITSSSWAAGTETLTVTGLTNGSSHIIGPFQVSGGACSTGTGEAYMTRSNAAAGTISYALASNPGSCAGGTFMFPDVRAFDEAVYQNDPSQTINPPGSVTVVVQ